VDKLYNNLHHLFLKELNDLKIGNVYNYSRMQHMIDIVNAIDYVKNSKLSRNEIIKILKYYE
jgi:hypothetical protein